jgi:hypothetical protein
VHVVAADVEEVEVLARVRREDPLFRERRELLEREALKARFLADHGRPRHGLFLPTRSTPRATLPARSDPRRLRCASVPTPSKIPRPLWNRRIESRDDVSESSDIRAETSDARSESSDVRPESPDALPESKELRPAPRDELPEC